MKRALAVFFTLALLSVSLFAVPAGATNSPGKAGGNATGGGTCNGPGYDTNNFNSGNHNGTANFGCYA